MTLKFRAYHQKQGLCYAEKLDSLGLKLCFDGSTIKVIYDDFVIESTWELSQFIGLQDINGQDLYHGDFIKWGHVCEYSQESPHRIAVIELNLPNLVFKCLNFTRDFNFGNFSYQQTHRFIEKIGNKYEDDIEAITGIKNLRI